MKIDDNGRIREMTEEEINAYETEKVAILPTAEERIEAMEEAFLELAEVLLNG